MFNLLLCIREIQRPHCLRSASIAVLEPSARASLAAAAEQEKNMFTAETVPASFVDRFVGLFYGSFGSHDWLAYSFRSSGSHHLFPVFFLVPSIETQ